MSSEKSEQISPMQIASFAASVSAHNKFRQDESRGGDIENRSRFLQEILTHNLTEWIKKGVPVSVSLDSNGLKLDVGSDKRSDGIHSHLPYAYVGEQELACLKQTGCMPSEDVTELDLRLARMRDDRPRIEALAQLQRTTFIEAVSGLRDGQSNSIAETLRSDAASVEKVLRSRDHSLHVPLEDVRYALTSDVVSADPGERVLALMRMAEAINSADREHNFQSEVTNVPQQMRDSHGPSRGTKTVFDPRFGALHQSRNYETAKILNTIFQTYSPKELSQAGVVVTRAAFKEGSEFISFQYANAYHRVLVQPSKHLDDTSRAMLENDSIPTLKREDFEFYEGLLLPFRAFGAAKRQLSEKLLDSVGNEKDGIRDQVLASLKSLRTIMETEFDEPQFRELFNAMRPVKKEIRAGRAPQESDVRNLLAVLDVLEVQYRDRFAGKQAPFIIAERLATITIHEQVYNELFLAGMPEALRAQAGEKFSLRFSGSGLRSRVFETGEKGLSYAHERKILGAMGLKPAPVIVAVGGAKFLNVASDAGAKARQIAESILRSAIQTGAHVLGPETQVGFGLILAQVFNEYYQTLSPEERERAPRIFGIGPGKDLYYQGNPIMRKDDAASLSVATPFDIIATPYEAGWSTHGSESQQRRHNYYRQAFIKRLSAGFSAAVVSADGGSWTVLESTAAAEDGFPVFPIAESGRFSSFISIVKENSSQWMHVRHDDAKLVAVLERIIANIDDPRLADTIRKDFEQNDLYRSELIEFLQTVDIDSIRPQSISTLEDSLVAELSKKTH